jgi:hypothetical protein
MLRCLTMVDRILIQSLKTRIAAIRTWLADEAPYVTTDQKHLNEHTPERAYWHFGYQAALADVLRLAEEDISQKRNNGDRSN